MASGRTSVRALVPRPHGIELLATDAAAPSSRLAAELIMGDPSRAILRRGEVRGDMGGGGICGAPVPGSGSTDRGVDVPPTASGLGFMQTRSTMGSALQRGQDRF